jgi:hypothetical protein
MRRIAAGRICSERVAKICGGNRLPQGLTLRHSPPHFLRVSSPAPSAGFPQLADFPKFSRNTLIFQEHFEWSLGGLLLR